jgi:hypothetical protein
MSAGVADARTLDEVGSEVFDRASRANRDLRLLHDIEQTISRLCYERKILDAIASFIQTVTTSLKDKPRDKQLDPQGVASKSLHEAQKAVHDLYDTMLSKRRSAEADTRLLEEDGVVEEYKRSITTVAELHNCLNDVRWAIGEHDASLAKPAIAAPLESEEAIESYLRTL